MREAFELAERHDGGALASLVARVERIEEGAGRFCEARHLLLRQPKGRATAHLKQPREHRRLTHEVDGAHDPAQMRTQHGRQTGRRKPWRCRRRARARRFQQGRSRRQSARLSEAAEQSLHRQPQSDSLLAQPHERGLEVLDRALLAGDENVEVLQGHGRRTPGRHCQLHRLSKQGKSSAWEKWRAKFSFDAWVFLCTEDANRAEREREEAAPLKPRPEPTPLRFAHRGVGPGASAGPPWQSCLASLGQSLTSSALGLGTPIHN